jgi:hypothetical protein
MEKRALSIGALSLALALFAVGGAVARTQATSITVRTAMTAADETPTPAGNVAAARGVFTATATKSDTGGVIDWQMTFDNLTGPARAAHIHVAPRGQPGPVVVPLCGPCASPASGNANVTPALLTALQTGGAYVNVHTGANAAGEIRGQLAVVATTTTLLTARQEVPRPKGSVGRARGSFRAAVTRSGTTGSLGWRLSYSGLTGRAVAAHIHIGASGRPGPVAVPLCAPCRTGMSRVVSLNAAALAAIEAGRAYVNVHTARNPAGEVRGQIAGLPLSVS